MTLMMQTLAVLTYDGHESLPTLPEMRKEETTPRSDQAWNRLVLLHSKKSSLGSFLDH